MPIPTLSSVSSGKPKLLDQVRQTIRRKHYSLRTEQAYVDWIRRYIFFHNKRHPAEMGAREMETFLNHLAVEKKVAASTQNQALSALVFLYREVLRQDFEWMENLERAKRPARVPVVLTEAEVKRLFAHLDGQNWLMASLLYGSGLRLMECVRLRVKDVDFEYRQITVRDGKGNKDRLTMLPDTCVDPLKRHLLRVKRYTSRTWRRVTEKSICRLRSSENIRTVESNGPGNMCFRRRSVRSIRAAARRGDITSTKRYCKDR